MIEMTRWDKALWFLSGSVALAAVVFLASSKETGAKSAGAVRLVRPELP